MTFPCSWISRSKTYWLTLEWPRAYTWAKAEGQIHLSRPTGRGITGVGDPRHF